jgi:hypothetical protein
VRELVEWDNFGEIIRRRTRRQAAYRPGLQDWLFHVTAPLAAYGVFAVSTPLAVSRFREALFGFGSAALLLLFPGVHNAWDAVA